jgi:hypothetical protein
MRELSPVQLDRVDGGGNEQTNCPFYTLLTTQTQ